MIPRAHVTGWRAIAPWPADAQVEQDLVLSRALVALFAEPAIAGAMAFRGGTALHKLLLPRPGRYSEDLDLVQVVPGPIGPVLDAMRTVLDPWLGKPVRKRSTGGVTVVYRFESAALPVQPLRVKVEINTREHGSVYGLRSQTFAVDNPWFRGEAPVVTYSVEELLGTKLRALYQRKKGRDLYDLWLVPSLVAVDAARVVAAFESYMEREHLRVTRAQFERNLSQKERMPAFLGDIDPLLPTGATFAPAAALEHVRTKLVARLPGLPWKTGTR